MEIKPLHFEITPEKIAAFEGRKKHDEVFEELLKEILPLDFRDYLGLPDDEHIRQKYIIVAVIKHLL